MNKGEELLVGDIARAETPKQVADEEILLARTARLAGGRRTARRALVPEQAFKDVDRRGEGRAGRSVRALAVPAAVGDARDAEARAGIADHVFGMALARAAPLDDRLTHALAVLRERTDRDIARIADDVGWSRKHLAARVRDAVGVGPRSFRRLLRFQTLTGMIGGAAGRPDWAALALDAGYCDQSHMIREFSEFSGLTPGMYLARTLPEGGGLVES